MVKKFPIKRRKREKQFILIKPKKEPDLKPQASLFNLVFIVTVFYLTDVWEVKIHCL